MNLQDKLISLSEYNISFRINDGNIIVSIEYKDGWTIISPEDSDVKLMKSKEKNVFYYCTNMDGDKSHVQGIFDTIDETIRFNKESEATVELFKAKIAELEKLFSEKSYDELKTLKFITKPVKSTNKKSKSKKEVGEKEISVTEKKEEEHKDVSTSTNFDKIIEESIKNKNKK